MASLSPLATLILQEAAARLGVIDAGAAGWGILPFVLLILLGNLLIAWRGGAAAGENLLAPVRVPEARARYAAGCRPALRDARRGSGVRRRPNVGSGSSAAGRLSLRPRATAGRSG